jgi:hypothetical protein
MTDNHQDQRPRQDTDTETSSGSFIDDEFAGRHGTVASKSSLKDEKRVGLHPQSLGEEVEKIREESDDEPGLLGTAKKVLQEADRQVSGEYEHREDVKAEGHPRKGPTND